MTLTARKTLLVALVCLIFGSLPGKSDGPEEKVWLQPSEISNGVLRQTLGVATISVLTEAPSLPSYRLQGAAFVPAGQIDLPRVTAVNGWDYEGVTLRRFPVLAERDGRALLALDGTGDATAWIAVPKEEPQVGQFPQVRVRSFVSADPQGLDLYFLLGGERRKVYERPADDSPYRVVTPTSLSFGLYGRRVENGFLEIVESQREGQVRIPRGWVRIRDAEGRLTLWYQSYDGC